MFWRMDFFFFCGSGCGCGCGCCFASDGGVGAGVADDAAFFGLDDWAAIFTLSLYVSLSLSLSLDEFLRWRRELLLSLSLSSLTGRGCVIPVDGGEPRRC